MNRVEAENLARDYLIEKVGNMVGPGEIYHDVKDETWVVPIIYQTPIQRIRIGDLKIDSESSRISAPSCSELLTNLEQEERKGATIIIHLERFDKEAVKVIRGIEGVKDAQCV